MDGEGPNLAVRDAKADPKVGPIVPNTGRADVESEEGTVEGVAVEDICGAGGESERSVEELDEHPDEFFSLKRQLLIYTWEHVNSITHRRPNGPMTQTYLSDL